MTIKNLYPTQRPALDLDFANSKRLDPRVSLTRASVGTYVGNDGLIKTAAAGAARFDHDPETGESLGLLVEESRTNLVTYSNMDSGWSLSQATFTPNTVLSPDGTFNAGTLTGNSTVTTHYINFNVSMGASPFTFTCFIKAGSISTASLFLTQSGNNGAAYNLSTGVVSNVQGTGNTASIQNAGNGWWRCSISNNGSADLFDSVRIGIDDTAYTAKSATGSIYIWGAQVEAGSFPTSYIPTSGSTVTRAADVASITGSNFSSWYNQSEGTFYSKGDLTYSYSGSNTFRTILLGGSFPSRRWSWSIIESLNSLSAGTDGMDHASFYANMSRNVPNNFNIAQAIKNTATTNVSSAADGVIKGSRTGFSSHTISSIQIGLSSFTGHISRLTYYPQRLPDATLQAMTL